MIWKKRPQRMGVAQCDMPEGCSFRPDIAKFYLWDSFEVPLNRTELGMQDVYLGIFAYPPRLFRLLVVIRNAIVGMFGISGPSLQQLNHVEIKSEYAVGDKIALFTLVSRSDSEIIAGGTDKHLDFRVSVLRMKNGNADSVVLTTVVDVHNFFGKIYLFFIMPFHRYFVRTILSAAVAANRI
jgi:uncharacterized protein DUF2867